MEKIKRIYRYIGQMTAANWGMTELAKGFQWDKINGNVSHSQVRARTGFKSF